MLSDIEIVVLGAQWVGKTSIIKKYNNIDKDFDKYNPTVGLDIVIKEYNFDNKKFTVKIWDTAGQERFKMITPFYMKKANVFIIVFDVTNLLSYEEISYWKKEIYKYCVTPNPNIYLIGNKIDQVHKRCVSNEMVSKILDSYIIKYFETSAKTGENIISSIDEIIKRYYIANLTYTLKDNTVIEKIIEVDENGYNKNSACC